MASSALGVVLIGPLPRTPSWLPLDPKSFEYVLRVSWLPGSQRLAVQTMLPVSTGYTTLEFKISFIRGMTEHTGVVRTEGRTLNAGRRAATAEARITDAKGRLLAHATTTCLVFEIPKGT